jgi:hypothetical protein
VPELLLQQMRGFCHSFQINSSMKTVKNLLIIVGTLCSILLSAQVSPTQTWIKTYSNIDSVQNTPTAVDANGNVIVAGSSYSAATGYDYTVIKYDKNGNQLWVSTYDGNSYQGTDRVTALTVDAVGNIFVTGKSQNNYVSYYATIKYDPNGNQQWIARYKGAQIVNDDDVPAAIALDQQGNVYVTGTSGLGAQFSWYQTIKYSPTGAELWVNRYTGSGQSAHAAGMIVNGNGIFVTGTSYDTTGGMHITMVTQRIDPNSGNITWQSVFNNLAPGSYSGANAIAADLNGNLYIAGITGNNSSQVSLYLTAKYNLSGDILWSQTYDGLGTNAYATALTIDNSSNVIVTGLNFTTGYIMEYHTLKYDNTGNQLWTSVFSEASGSGDDQKINLNNHIVSDSIGNSYICGEHWNGSNFDIVTLKYAATGAIAWNATYHNAGGSGFAVDLFLDKGTVFVSGAVKQNGLDELVTIKYNQSPPIEVPLINCGFDQLLSSSLSDSLAKIRYDTLSGMLHRQVQKMMASHSLLSNNYIIPVVVHIIGTNANAIVSDAVVINEINTLNTAFANMMGSTESSAMNANITFCLAQKTPNGAAWSAYGSTTPGITRWSSPTIDILANNHDMLVNSPNGQTALTNLVYFNSSAYLNIWVVNGISLQSTPYINNVLGYSPYPLTMGPNQGQYLDGIVIRDDAFGNGSSLAGHNQGKTLVHEVGHYFSVLHPFSNACNEVTNNLPCGSIGAGDECCDTPPISGPSSGCPIGRNSCNIVPVPAMISNHMDYSDDPCRNTFTSDQVVRMQAGIQTFRPFLVSFPNLLQTGVACMPAGLNPTFTTNLNNGSTQFCAGTPTSNVVGFLSAPGATGYAWTFSGGNPSTSTAPNPTGIYWTTPGVYLVSLTVTDASGNSLSSSLQVFVSNCTPIVSPNANWYFGVTGAISFAGGFPQPILPSSMNTAEGAASISTSNGSLLFYTNGKSVWQSDHNLMPHGNNTMNGSPNSSFPPSAGQGVVIVPVPGNPQQYSIFVTSDAPTTSSGVNYGVSQYIVDMSLNAPYGDLVSTVPNHPLQNYATTEPVVAIPNCNGIDYWLIVKPTTNNYPGLVTQATNVNANTEIASYAITASGLSNTPVLTAASPFVSPTFSSGNNWVGHIAVSPNRKIIAFNDPASLHVYLYYFDCSTGIMNFLTTLTLDGSQLDQVCFSPNSHVLYCLVNSPKPSIRQYDLSNISVCNGIPPFIDFENIPNSVPVNQLGYLSDLKLGPDKKIYAARNGNVGTITAQHELAVINFPDVLNTSPTSNECGYNYHGVYLNNTQYSLVDLPNDIEGLSAPVTDNFSFCISNCSQVCFTNFGCGTSFSWNFGDSYSTAGVNSTIPVGTNNSTTSGNFEYPCHIYAANGTYTVTLSIDGRPAISQKITISKPLAPVITGPATLCLPLPTQPSSYFGPNNYLYNWSATNGIPTSGSNQTFNLTWQTLPATVSLTVTDPITGCKSPATVLTINSAPSPSLTVSPNQQICSGSVPLSATASSGSTFSWSPTSTLSCSSCANPIASPPTTTTYTVAAMLSGCISSTFVTVTVDPHPPIIFTPSSPSLCYGSSVAISASGSANYSWSPALNLSCNTCSTTTANPTTATTYTVTGNLSGCSSSSTITVNVNPLPVVTASAAPNPVCINAITVLTASPSTFASYSWDNGAGSNAITSVSFPAPGPLTYHVFATDNNGCRNFASVSVNFVQSTYFTYTVSNCNTILFKTLGCATNYSWNYGDGTTGSGATSSHTYPAGFGTYTVTLTANGTQSSTQIITVGIPLPVISGTQCISGPGNVGTYSISNPGAYSYSWSANGGSCSPSTGTSSSVNWTNSTGSITLTTTDSKGCSSSVTMTVGACCSVTGIPTTQIVPPNGASSSSYTSPWGPGGAVINGKLMINSNFTISNVNNVNIAANTQIRVQSGFTLTINNSVLDACNEMWDGIYIEPGGALVTNGSTYYDAMNAIVSLNKTGISNFTVNGCTFNNNYKAIVVKDYFNSTLHPGTVQGSTFETTGHLKAPYAGNNGLSGVEITNCPTGGVKIGITTAGTLPNVFNGTGTYGLDYGITSNAATVFSYNNTFKNIYKSNPPCLRGKPCPVVGIAIWAIGGELSVGGTGLNQPNDFGNCYIGILSDGTAQSYIEKNAFHNFHTGLGGSTCVAVQNQKNSQATIQDNTFSKIYQAVSIWNGVFSQNYVLSNQFDDFTYYGITIRQANHCNLGISGNKFNTTAGNHSGNNAIMIGNAVIIPVGQASITSNQILNCNNGILVQNYPGVFVMDQNGTNGYITFASSLAVGTHYGIRILNCSGAYISNNIVDKIGSMPTSATTLYGISLETNCLHSIVKSNTLSRLGTGLNFLNSNNYPTQVTCNVMSRNRTGLMLDHTDIGPQGSPGVGGIASDNEWSIPAGTTGVRGAGPLPSATHRLWYVRNIVGQWFPTNNISPPQTIISSIQKSLGTCPNICYSAPCLQTALVQVAKNQASFNSQSLVQQHLNAQSVYQTLKTDSTLTNQGTALDLLLVNYSDSLAATNIGQLYQVSTSLASGNIVLAKTQNASFVPSNIPEQNQQIVNGVFIDTWANGEFVLTQKDTLILRKIAKQNIIEGGTAVYDARLMIGEDYSDFLANQREFEGAENDNSSEVLDLTGILYPNPANNQVNYSITLNEGQVGEWYMYDVNGKQLRAEKIHSGENVLNIQTGGLSDGLYFYRLLIDGRQIGSGRFVIGH